MSTSERSKAFEALIAADQGHDLTIRPPRKRRKKAAAPYSIRFTDEERLILDRESGRLSWSAYIREKLFGGTTRNKPPVKKRRAPSVDQAAIAQALAKLGSSHLASNLNQIAKAANMGALPVDNDLLRELNQACADIRFMRVQLTEALRVEVKDGTP